LRSRTSTLHDPDHAVRKAEALCHDSNNINEQGLAQRWVFTFDALERIRVKFIEHARHLSLDGRTARLPDRRMSAQATHACCPPFLRIDDNADAALEDAALENEMKCIEVAGSAAGR